VDINIKALYLKKMKIKKKKFNKVILIPARSGSKRLKDKNILKINNKNLIYYTIKHALSLKGIDHVIVSTDSVKYAQIAKKCGAKIFYLRPKNLSKDTTTDFEVFKYNESWLNLNLKYFTDIYIHLRPTFPIRRLEDTSKMIKLMEKNFKKTDSVRSIIKSKIKLEKFYYFDHDKLLKNNYAFEKDENNLEIKGNQSDQSLKTWYKHNGNVDVFKAKILKRNTISGKKILSYVQNNNFDYDINTITDLKIISKILKFHKS
tara:strand:- start:5275 stop:6054 length:780 start_codon:yes stop_codon:yes gene_type:complete